MKKSADGMIEAVVADVRKTEIYTGLSSLSPVVLAALANVPRHRFVAANLQDVAYANRPLPIGQSQTISQPFIVALMTECLEPQPHHTILEIGTGCGYQAAVLAQIVKEVFSVEIIEPLSRSAQRICRELGYQNIHFKVGDGYQGWAEHQPFDGIIVTAAAPEIPQPLVDQLKPGGKMIIPVGLVGGHQSLKFVEKDKDGELSVTEKLDVAFVPFTRSPLDQ